MRVYFVLGLLFVVANGEKKINLEDIERDTLRAESKAKTGSAPTEETSYAEKSPVTQQQYQLSPSRYSIPNIQPDAYSGHQVPPQDYNQPGKYIDEVSYQQQNGIPEQNGQLQYYSNYQQTEVPVKNTPVGTYESQQLIYQPEVVVGNKIQSVQQKAATQKYTKHGNKETVYIDIPMHQLLSYYPSLHHLAAQATQQLPLPVYTPFVAPARPSYQIQYAPKYASSQTASGTKTHGVYTTAKKQEITSLLMTPVFLQPDQSHAQGRKLLYTQAYIPHPQYTQQLVYPHPGLYMTAVPIYSDPYTQVPSYVQDNSLHGQTGQYNTPQQVYVTEPQHSKQPLSQQTSQTVSQTYTKVPDEPSTHFVPPQLPAQNFNDEVTQLVAVPPGDDEAAASLPAKSEINSSEPRSLLDSYVPSKIIAAQDSDRYKERPLKLEGGFLPSKINFIHKKRRTDQ